MKNSKINYSCPISNTRLYTSGNNDLVYVKPYKGDWGDWDEQPFCAINDADDLDLETATQDDETITDKFF